MYLIYGKQKESSVRSPWWSWFTSTKLNGIVCYIGKLLDVEI